MRDPDVEAAFERALSRFDGNNFERLTTAEQVLVTIWGLEAEVNNGGFDQYYFNGAGDLAFFAPQALRLIGAHRMADIVARANAVFGPDGPARAHRARQAQRDLVAPDDHDGPWDRLDEEFYEYPDDIGALLVGFVRAAARSGE
jgi:hypothetical protein